MYNNNFLSNNSVTVTKLGIISKLFHQAMITLLFQNILEAKNIIFSTKYLNTKHRVHRLMICEAMHATSLTCGNRPKQAVKEETVIAFHNWKYKHFELPPSKPKNILVICTSCTNFTNLQISPQWDQQRYSSSSSCARNKAFWTDTFSRLIIK